MSEYHPFLSYLLLALALTFIFREYAVVRGMRTVRYLLTPLVTFWICMVAFLALAGCGASRYRIVIMLGLLLSLVADTILMVKEIDLLKFALPYFLSAHVLYICAFAWGYDFRPWHILPATVLALSLGFLLMKMRGRTKGLDIPIAIYASTIAFMVFFAVSLPGRMQGTGGIFAAVGGVLFLISDGILAFNAFIRPIPHDSAVVWAFYAPGQLMIALSTF